MAIKKTYYDCAEDDYKYFMASYNYGMIHNSMTAIAQNTCERYLKYIIEKKFKVTEDTSKKKAKILKSHSLNDLIYFIESELKLEFGTANKDTILLSQGYYISARYPSDISDITQEDVDKCKLSIEACKKWVDNLLKMNDEKNKSVSDLLKEIEGAR